MKSTYPRDVPLALLDPLLDTYSVDGAEDPASIQNLRPRRRIFKATKSERFILTS